MQARAMAMGWCPGKILAPTRAFGGFFKGWTNFPQQQTLLAAAPRSLLCRLCTLHGQLLKQLAARGIPEAHPSGWTTATAA